MKKELKEKLEKELEKAGLDKGLLMFINITKEDEIQGVIDNLTKLKTPTPTTEEILKSQDVQSEIDRRISEAKKKWEEGKPEPPKPDDPPSGEITAESIAKIVAEAQKPLLEKLNGFEQNRTREGKISQARKALLESKIPEKNRDFYLDLYNPDSDTKIEDWVKQAEEKHEAYVQTLLDEKQLAEGPPKFADSTEPTPEELDKRLESMGV